MAPKQPQQQCARYQYVVTSAGPKIVPVPDVESKDEESAVEYNSGGYLPVKLHDTFKDGRYIVLRKLGWGHFSTVWLVKDTEANRHSALKVVKSAGRYAETARDEIKLLRKVMMANPTHPGREHIVSFLDSFQHVGPEESHVCIVFEPLGESLLSLIERNKVKGVPRGLVKSIARQILLGLQYLHDECDLVHTDIKPENIMISIPDVESLILAELSSSPPPTCRRVGVPPGKSRTGVSIPKKGRERQVHIFDSQPLPSPSSASLSRSSSPGCHPGLRMSQITSPTTTTNGTGGGGKQNGKSAPHSLANSASTSVESMSLASASASIVSSTPPTSFGSVISKMDVVPPKPSAGEEIRVAEESLSKLVISPKEDLPPRQMNANAPAPSLLSQTAPHHLSSTSSRTSSNTDTPVLRPTTSPSSRAGSIVSPVSPAIPPIQIKIADLGNATPSKIHFTEDIQTRQYRAPEAILGRSDWGCTADIWSVACVIFELLTAEYLFDPQSQGEIFSKDDDHMAQIIELLGDFPIDVKMGGKYSREIFDSSGSLRYIKSLKPWPLKRVMMEKYLFTERDAESLTSFLEPMLKCDFRIRATAEEMVDHEWLFSVDEVPDGECL